MTARASVQSLLEGDATLQGLGFFSVEAANSVDTPPDNRFLIVKWLNKSIAFGSEGSTILQIWAHDVDKDYTQIGKALKRIREILLGAVHVVGEDGWSLTVAEDAGEGPDLYDDGYGTCVRYAEFSVVSRYSVP
jgi:hypothetical protein